MPIYMDRHDVSDIVTAENVAQLHQEDLKIQHKFGCRGLTYWFDDKRNTAFCLIEAPDAQAIQQMHLHAHGQVPHKVIEVDPVLVESFLGRIEDPANTRQTKLNSINEPAFRAIMRMELIYHRLTHEDTPTLRAVSEMVPEYNGRIVEQKIDQLLVSFTSASAAIECANKCRLTFSKLASQNLSDATLKIAISAGVPVTNENVLFAKAIEAAKRICHINKAAIVISPNVADWYQNENLNADLTSEHLYALTRAEETFLHTLMDFVESRWEDEQLRVDDFTALGFSKSQLYRKLTELTGNSPNSFLKEYRLKKALHLLLKNEANVSEVSALTGFNSPSYFAKCFKKKYGIAPSDYLPDRKE